MGRQQLFTENTLTVILPLLHEKKLSTLLGVLRLWSVVLTANLLGALIFAGVVAHTRVFEPAVMDAFAQIGREALGADFGTVVLRGVFAGWLIALMVWLLPTADASRLAVILILTYVVALGGFAHIIAGSVEVMYLAILGLTSWRECLLDWMLPALLGNILGGVSLVAALNHAQVTSGSSGGQAGAGERAAA